MNSGEKSNVMRMLPFVAGCLLVVSGCEDTGDGAGGPPGGGQISLDGGDSPGSAAPTGDAGADGAPPPSSTKCYVTAETYRQTSAANEFSGSWGITYDAMGVASKVVRYDANNFEDVTLTVTSPSAVAQAGSYGETLTKFTAPVFSKTVAYPPTSTVDVDTGNNPKSDYYVRQYEYDAKHRLIKRTESVPSVPKALPSVWEITYDDDDNVRTFSTDLLESESPQPPIVYTVTGYDDKPSPRSATPYAIHLWTPVDSITDLIDSLSQNNLLGYERGGTSPATLTATYQYNAHGYPVERQTVITDGANTTRRQTFTYDCK